MDADRITAVDGHGLPLDRVPRRGPSRSRDRRALAGSTDALLGCKSHHCHPEWRAVLLLDRNDVDRIRTDDAQVTVVDLLLAKPPSSGVPTARVAQTHRPTRTNWRSAGGRW